MVGETPKYPPFKPNKHLPRHWSSDENHGPHGIPDNPFPLEVKTKKMINHTTHGYLTTYQ